MQANASAALAFINTLLATVAAVSACTVVEQLARGESSKLAGASGAVAGLVGIIIVWIGQASVITFLIATLVFGVRVSEEAEREGLDITSHGETAYEN